MTISSSNACGRFGRSFWHQSALKPARLSWHAMVLGGLLALAPLAQAHEPADSYPRATLSAQASTEVQQDTVQVTLSAELSGTTQQQVSDQLNTRLDAAMKQAKGHDNIEVRSGAYRIWPSNDRDGKIAEWRGRAEILLKSQDFNATSQLAAQMSPHLSIDGLSFSVSRKRQAAEEQKLMQQAVQAFRDRAQALTQALQFPSYRLHSLDLGGSGEISYAPAPRMMMSAMAADKVAAPLEAGQQTISVSVQGVIVLQPAKTDPGQSTPLE
ncbi:SIMPL domain-containing protein [Castellaniella sp.]|uniref:SIMPL domain-containing protein n=1 Tax=Castellaniella sp. TaxID=1955812 RepID=UPI002AFEEABC|nr:SIMPL domain-containing protein [Castellaniella sp.]